MPDSPFLVAFLWLVAIVLTVLIGFMLYVVVRYSPIIGRIFEEKPLFLPLRLPPAPDAEDVRFNASDGIELAGSYLRARTATRVGTMVFCHEFLSDRWSYRPYLDALRDLGYDLFTFDFRNHGASGSEPKYRPLQWVTDHELRDLEAALGYLRSRDDRDPAGFGLFGVSRGGSAALAVAAANDDVWGVVTDGAFPTHGTMYAYILKWAEIYVGNQELWKHMPHWVFHLLAYLGRIRSQTRLHCRFPHVESAVSRIAPRPWLMIHGAKDAYIGPAIAERLFALAGPPKDKWIVPRAKHNRCRDVEPAEYERRIAAFLAQYAPRSPLPAGVNGNVASWPAGAADSAANGASPQIDEELAVGGGVGGTARG